EPGLVLLLPPPAPPDRESREQVWEPRAHPGQVQPLGEDEPHRPLQTLVVVLLEGVGLAQRRGFRANRGRGTFFSFFFLNTMYGPICRVRVKNGARSCVIFDARRVPGRKVVGARLEAATLDPHVAVVPERFQGPVDGPT